MTKDSQFYFDIENIKNDLAMEGMTLTDADIVLLKEYIDNKISLNELTTFIKNETLERIK